MYRNVATVDEGSLKIMDAAANKKQRNLQKLCVQNNTKLRTVQIYSVLYWNRTHYEKHGRLFIS
jgi:hypothetical protein